MFIYFFFLASIHAEKHKTYFRSVKKKFTFLYKQKRQE